MKNEKTKMKNKKNRFKKGMTIYIIAAFILLVIGFVWFYSFISSYEKSQPSNAMKEVQTSFTEDKIENFLDDYLTEENSFDSIDKILNEYKKLIKDKEITYREDSTYRESEPVYLVLADGKAVAKVIMGKEDSKIGFDRWAIKYVYVADYLPDTQEIKISAPAGTVLKVNGKKVTDQYMTQADGIPEILVGVEEYLSDIPSTATYVIKGLLETPTVTAEDSEGNELEVFAGEGSYSVGYGADEEFIASVNGRVESIIEAYGLYFINQGSSLTNYLLPDSQLAEDISLTVTGFYLNSKLTGYDFSSLTTSNYTRYSEDCFTVDIYYKLDVSFVSSAYRDDNQYADATWVFIKQDGKWYLSYCQNKS